MNRARQAKQRMNCPLGKLFLFMNTILLDGLNAGLFGSR